MAKGSFCPTAHERFDRGITVETTIEKHLDLFLFLRCPEKIEP
jgi:hypothetical protein